MLEQLKAASALPRDHLARQLHRGDAVRGRLKRRASMLKELEHKVLATLNDSKMKRRHTRRVEGRETFGIELARIEHRHKACASGTHLVTLAYEMQHVGAVLARLVGVRSMLQ